MHAIIIFDEMQNGAIWGHFRVSYNIESSTILMTNRQEYLKIVKDLPFVSLADTNTSIALYKSTSKSRWICINPREDILPFFIAELTQVFKHLSTLNDILGVVLAAGMFNKTHNIVSIEGLRTGFTEFSVVQSRAFERGFIRCIGKGPGESRKGPWISEVPHLLSHWRFILICSLSIWYFKFKSTILREVSACPQVPKQYCSALQYFFWRPCCRYIIIILFSQPIIKWQKNITLSEKFQKFNRKIVEIGKFDIPNTHIHDL